MGSTLDVRHHFADLGEVLMHYVTAGQGPPVVLLHGWPQTWWEWRHVIPALAETYSVIAPDLRGLGDSSRPLDGYDKRTIANDIWLLVAERLGDRSFWLGMIGAAPRHLRWRPHIPKRCAASSFWTWSFPAPAAIFRKVADAGITSST
jgi:pimeloyl-ACP methyl ester carboxylesterase